VVTINDHQRFGALLKDRRNVKEISIRPLAEKLNISPGHYCDIESGRRSPPDRDFLDALVTHLHLHYEDKQTLYDLWGKARSASPPDLTDYINESAAARIALRLAKEKATDADWKRFVQQLEEKEQLPS